MQSAQTPLGVMNVHVNLDIQAGTLTQDVLITMNVDTVSKHNIKYYCIIYNTKYDVCLFVCL